MQNTFLKRPILWGIQLWQPMALFGLYVFFGSMYWGTLLYQSDGQTNLWKEILGDYILKLILVVPIWWLFFVYFKNKSPLFKIVLHIACWQIYLWTWFFLYHFLMESFGWFYLRGAGQAWDLYIPSVVYLLQFAIFHLYDYWLQNEKQKAKEKELLQIAYNSEVNALKAQIQPHFLFNTLNSISASVPIHMEHTRELIAKLADTFRYSLQASEQEWISLEEELNFTKTTLDLEKERLKDRLTVTYDIDETLLQIKVPPMLLQPITENAIKHGIAPKIEGGIIHIGMKKIANKVHISISDTGQGMEGDIGPAIFTKGIGLRNTNQRLEKLFDEKITVTKNSPSGLIFSFNIPIYAR
jgi:two-component system, LytTR family, sensor kinase